MASTQSDEHEANRFNRIGRPVNPRSAPDVSLLPLRPPLCRRGAGAGSGRVRRKKWWKSQPGKAAALLLDCGSNQSAARQRRKFRDQGVSFYHLIEIDIHRRRQSRRTGRNVEHLTRAHESRLVAVFRQEDTGAAFERDGVASAGARGFENYRRAGDGNGDSRVFGVRA